MKELVVISGKGGTGKTTVLGCFAALANRSILADCDVDAPDLYLLLHPQETSSEEFMGGKIAVMDKSKCIECGRCWQACRFDAIDEKLNIEPLDCEGCGACAVVCPVDAITMQDRIAGDFFRSETKYGPMIHARLRPAEENSGKLVALVRKESRKRAEEENLDLVLTDGPPGIGCPVIASLGNADYALIVTEPTPSGIHDLERVVGVCRHFDVPAMVCVNKYDLNLDVDRQIRDFCRQNDIAVTTGIPFDESVPDAVSQGLPLVEYGDCPALTAIRTVWQEVNSALDQAKPRK